MNSHFSENPHFNTSPQTLRAKCPAIDPYVIGGWFHQTDKDQDGRLTKDEFVSLFRQHYGGADKDHLQALARTLHKLSESQKLKDLNLKLDTTAAAVA